MRKSTKAVLLSGLVFPGTGHMYLKQRITGAVLACASLAAFYLIVSNLWGRAMQIVEKIERGEVDPDAAAIADLLSRQPSGDESQLSAAWAILILCWFVGIVDSYRRGRAQDEIDLER